MDSTRRGTRGAIVCEEPMDCGCLPGGILCDDIGPVLAALQKEFFAAVSTGDWEEFDALREVFVGHMTAGADGPPSGRRRAV